MSCIILKDRYLTTILEPLVRTLKGKNILLYNICGKSEIKYFTDKGARVYFWPDLHSYGAQEFDLIFFQEEDLKYCDIHSVMNCSRKFLKTEGQFIISVTNSLSLEKPAMAENKDDLSWNRNRLSVVLSDAGFPWVDYFYSYPGYSDPSVILSEKAIRSKSIDLYNLLAPFLSLEQRRRPANGLSGMKFFRELVENDLCGFFSNAIIAVARKTENKIFDENILGWTFSKGRAALNKINVFRLMDNDTVEVHKQYEGSFSYNDKTSPLRHILKNEPYYKGRLYYLTFLEIISTPGWSMEELEKWFYPYLAFLKSLAFHNGETLMLEGQLIDATPFNLIEDNQKFLLFDQEWHAGENIPLSYVAFRALYFSLSKPDLFEHPKAETPLYAYEICNQIIGKHFNTALDLTVEFEFFQNKYFQCSLDRQNGTPYNFHIACDPENEKLAFYPLEQMSCLGSLHCKVYWQNTDQHFSEENYRDIHIDLAYKFTRYKIELSPKVTGIQKLRIDPAERTGIVCCRSIYIKNDEGSSLAVLSTESKENPALENVCLLKAEDGYCYFMIFLTDDPMITFELPQVGKANNNITIEIELAAVRYSDIKNIGERLNNILWWAAMEKPRIDQQSPPSIALLTNDLLLNTGEALKLSAKKAEADLSSLQYHFDRLSRSSSAMMDKMIILEQVRAELNIERAERSRLENWLHWYYQTFETRSLTGIIKDRMQKGLRRLRHKFIKRILDLPPIRKKYVTSYILDYCDRLGFKKSIRTAIGIIVGNGTLTFTFLRKTAINKITQNKPGASAGSDILHWKIDLAEVHAKIGSLRYRPLISVIIPVFNPAFKWLKAAVDSVRNQIYTPWELCIGDDCSNDPEIVIYLNSLKEDNVHVIFSKKNRGISETSNEAVKLCSGAYIALLDHDDLLSEDALFQVAQEINNNETVDIIYSDECKIGPEGTFSDFFCKPDWSPELLLNMMYTGHLTVYRKAFMDETIGWFRTAYDFSQDYDLFLRASEKTENIFHISRILYYWRITDGSAAGGHKPFARKSNLEALQDAVKRRAWPAVVAELPMANRVRFSSGAELPVSVIIPTDSLENLSAVLNSLLTITKYSCFEIVVVTNSNLEHIGKTSFHDQRIRFVTYDLPFNFSDKCNKGVQYAKSGIVIILNDDVRPDHEDWIDQLIEYLFVDGVGAVSPKLLYENNRIQYAGMVTGVRNMTGTAFHNYQENDRGYFHFVQLVRDVSILSGACMAIKKSLFQELGGFDSVNTPINHSDVDFSFRLREKGYRCVYTPYSTLHHTGHASLGVAESLAPSTKDKSDIFLFKQWSAFIANDPYFTKPMRDLLYHDSPEPMQWFAPFENTERIYVNGDVLLVSHDFSLSGAPFMLLHIAQILRDQGYFVIVAAPVDGPLRNKFQQEGFMVLIDPLVLQAHPSFLKLAKNFDLLICNTVLSWRIVEQMQNIVKTIWWIQEGKVIEDFLSQPGFSDMLRNAHHIAGVSDYSLSWISPYQKRYFKIYNAVPDMNSKVDFLPPFIGRPFVFAIIGTVEHRKGHDILLKAMSVIPIALHSLFEVRVIGRQADQEFTRLLGEIENVKLLGEADHESCIHMMNGADAVISASRDDPFPLVMVEAMSLGKAIIISSHNGLIELIVDENNGFIFENEDALSLAEHMLAVMSDPELRESVGRNARETYLRFLTLKIFKESLTRWISTLHEPQYAGIFEP